MSKILNKASLLLNPAGSSIAYKEGEILSVFPDDGSGDFAFNGGDGGTRVNQDGYIEVTPANILTYSSTFSNGVWQKTQSAVNTTTVVRDPFGGLNAWKYTENTTGNNYSRLRQSFLPLIAGRVFTTSFYVKAAERNQVMVYCNWASAGVWFDVESGVFLSYYNGTSTNIVDYGIENAGGGWFRVWVAASTVNTSTQYTEIFVSQAQDIYASKTVGYGVYIYGAQLVEGSIPKPYQPTTNRLSYPRITYENGRGALMNELSRTNINLFSTGPTGSFTTSGNANSDGRYFYSQATLINKTSLSPDGTNNAYEMEMHNSSYDMYSRFNGLPVGDQYVFSMYVKLGTARNFCVVINNTQAWNTVTGSVFTAPELSDQHYTRVEVPFTVPASGQVNVHLGGHSENMTQQDAGTVFLYGSQMEYGTFNISKATSYIPTTTAAVTRPRDVPRSTSVSSLVGQSSGGTLYISGTPKALDHEFVALTPSGYNTTNIVVIYHNGGNLRLYVVADGNNIIAGTSAPISLGQYFKAAVRYKDGDTAYYVNGQQVITTSTSFTFGLTLNRLDLNSSNYYYATPGAQEINTFASYTTGLSNTQLEELTTINSGSGGNISYYGPYTIHTFTSSGTFTPSFSGEVEVLVVAGGGSGGVGSNGGGGGGAGGLLHTKSYTVTQGTGIPVVVGSGGARRIGRGSGNNGSNSTFGDLTTLGGGGGGGASGGAQGKDGGSGGGAQYSSYGGVGRDQQGNGGGDGNYYLGGNHDAGGGGGGAGFAGLDATLSNAGNGGDGLEYSISGFPTYYAGGGGGSSNNASAPQPLYPGEGGLGGGGKGGIQGTTLLGTDGVDGLGAGGGAGVGSSGGNSGAGGDGIVIVRYLT